MASSLHHFHPENDSIEVTMSGWTGSVIKIGNGNSSQSPVYFLEAALSGCIGLTLLSICSKKGIDSNSILLKYNVKIRAGKIRIEYSCADEIKGLFMEAVESCYISRLVQLDKQFVYNFNLSDQKSGITA